MVAGFIAYEVPPEIDHGHGQDVVAGEAGRIRRVLGAVDVQPVIARAHDEKNVLAAGVLDRRLELGQRRGRRVADEAAPVDDPGAVVRRVADGPGRASGTLLLRFGPSLGADLEEHHRHVPIDAGDSDPVVPARPDDAQGRDAVPVGLDAVRSPSVENVTIRIGVVEGEVPAHHVVDIAVAVVVDPVGLLGMPGGVQAGFAGVGPDVAGQVFVIVEEAVVQEGHDDLAAASRNRPSAGDVGVDSREGVERHRRGFGRRSLEDDRPPGIQEARLVFEERIVGDDPRRRGLAGQDGNGRMNDGRDDERRAEEGGKYLILVFHAECSP